VFTARYALSPYIKQIRFVFKGLNPRFRIFTSMPSEQASLVCCSLSCLLFGFIRIWALKGWKGLGEVETYVWSQQAYHFTSPVNRPEIKVVFLIRIVNKCKGHPITFLCRHRWEAEVFQEACVCRSLFLWRNPPNTSKWTVRVLKALACIFHCPCNSVEFSERSMPLNWLFRTFRAIQLTVQNVRCY
jgi:hypothetical protein